eukprot:11211198-Lingulodinium_polyedra.AAC.1
MGLSRKVGKSGTLEIAVLRTPHGVGKVGKVGNSGVSTAPWRRGSRKSRTSPKSRKVGNSGVLAAP